MNKAREYEWSYIKKLPQISFIPEHYDVVEKRVGRSGLNLIHPYLWPQIEDFKWYRRVPNSGEEEIGLRAYYTCASYHVVRREKIDIPAGEPFELSVLIHHTSTIREACKENCYLENCFDLEDNALREGVAYQYGIDEIDRYCDPEFAEQSDTLVLPSVEYDRVAAFYDFEQVVGLYREDAQSNISLVGCSDYLIDMGHQIYPESSVYWSERQNRERIERMEQRPVDFGPEAFRSIFLPGRLPLKTRRQHVQARKDAARYVDWLEKLEHSENPLNEKIEKLPK